MSQEDNYPAQSGDALGAFLQTPPAALDKPLGPMGARCLSHQGQTQRTAGGRKTRGEENLMKDTPPNKTIWSPLRLVRFHPPQCHCPVFPVQKYKNEQIRSSFGGIQKFF